MTTKRVWVEVERAECLPDMAAPSMPFDEVWRLDNEMSLSVSVSRSAGDQWFSRQWIVHDDARKWAHLPDCSALHRLFVYVDGRCRLDREVRRSQADGGFSCHTYSNQPNGKCAFVYALTLRPGRGYSQGATSIENFAFFPLEAAAALCRSLRLPPPPVEPKATNMLDNR